MLLSENDRCDLSFSEYVEHVWWLLVIGIIYPCVFCLVQSVDLNEMRFTSSKLFHLFSIGVNQIENKHFDSIVT